MTSAPGGLFHLQRSFADVDDLIAQARHWNLEFRQLDRGGFQGELLQFMAQGVQIAEARFRRALHQTGAPPSDLRTIAVPASPDVNLVWRGLQIDGNSLMLFPLGGELASVSGPDFHVYTCSLPESILDLACESAQLGTFRDLVDREEAIHCNPVQMQRLRHCLVGLCETVRHGGNRHGGNGSHSADFSDQLTTCLPAAIVSAIADAQGRCRPATTSKRETALARALDFFEATIQEDISIRDVVQAAGVSPRTLEYAFADRFGVTPKEYMSLIRLRGARIQLRQACSRRTRVSDVAGQWGFWHMGQFAADYRRHFGELPSTTLER